MTRARPSPSSRSPRVAGAGAGGVRRHRSEEATPSTNVDQLLRQTFSGDKQIESGRLALDLQLDRAAARRRRVRRPGRDQAVRPVRVRRATAACRSSPSTPSCNGGGQRIDGGRHLDRRQGLRQLPGPGLRAARPALHAVQGRLRGGAEARQRVQGRSFAALGLDPRRWLKDARNAGESRSATRRRSRSPATSTSPALLDDVEAALRKARSLGLEGAGELPDRPDGAAAAPGRAGREGRRRGDPHRQGRQDPAPHEASTSHRPTRTAGERHARPRPPPHGVNEDQDIPEPSDAKPFADLAGQPADARPRARRRRAVERQRQRRRGSRPAPLLALRHGGRQRRSRGPQVRRPADALTG